MIVSCCEAKIFLLQSFCSLFSILFLSFTSPSKDICEDGKGVVFGVWLEWQY